MSVIYVDNYHIEETAPSAKKILIYTGECYLFRILGRTDNLNDYSFLVYDGIDNTGNVIYPNASEEADYKGARGYTASNPDKCYTGLCLYVTCAGDMELTVKYRTADSLQRTFSLPR